MPSTHQEEALWVGDDGRVPERKVPDVRLGDDVVRQLEVRPPAEGVAELAALLDQDAAPHCVPPERPHAQQVVAPDPAVFCVVGGYIIIVSLYPDATGVPKRVRALDMHPRRTRRLHANTCGARGGWLAPGELGVRHRRVVVQGRVQGSVVRL